MSRETIRIPRRFFDDHECRDLPTPTVFHSTMRHVWISPDDPELAELVSDARYYAHPLGPEDEAGLARSATALLRALDGEIGG